ncbi:DUF58 domain-containing protein [Candidatus Sumerlaeota bacterium]|nr:DUF58 domain-containing protein [Candidatus Sumerlaeota bacterium]
MIPQEILKQVRRIELATRKAVNDVMAGEYHSVFKGRGMDFDEVREYQPGDEVRSIDWNVSARMGRPYIKRYMEERELTVMLMVDASGSLDFGSGSQMKGKTAVMICALLAFAAIKNNDQVGLIIFTDEVELYLPPKKGRKHVLQVIRELLYFEPRRRGTDIGGALEYMNRVTKRRSVVFLVSDFADEHLYKSLLIANRKHDLVALRIHDQREMELPPVGLLELQDAETGEVVMLDTFSAGVRRSFERKARETATGLENLFKRLSIDSVDFETEEDYVEPLIRFFRRRAQRA